MKRRLSLIAAALVLLAGVLLLGTHAVFSDKEEVSAAQATPRSDQGSGNREADASARRPRSQPARERASLIKRMLSGEEVHLTLSVSELEHFLERYGRNPGTLLAASRLAGEDGAAYLQEAARLYPDHPMILQELFNKATDPEEKLAVLARLRKADPENSLGDLLEASLRFKHGDRAQAIADLEQASGHSRFDAYAEGYIGNIEIAYHSAGFSKVDASAAATFSLAMPEIMSLRDVAAGVDAEYAAAMAGGDTEGAHRVLELAASKRIRKESLSAVQELAAISMEMKLLKSAPANEELATYDNSASEVMADLTLRRERIRELTNASTPLLEAATEEQLRRYFETVHERGELQAIQELAEARR